jgi:prepilin-type N-terminal cleavage/methylation domain-containing protein/prepilin-type processing-associated H-X9-DG protein
MSRHYAHGRGFTLVELLVVIAIIGVLVALLLPAVQSAREASRRQACLNNLKQMALACHSYHDTWNVLPVGAMTARLGEGNENDGYGWALAILPFMEQKAIFDLINPNGRPAVISDYFRANNRPIPGGETPIKTFRCPTSQLPKVVPENWRIPGGPVVPVTNRRMAGYAVNDYKGNGGGCHSENDGVIGKRAEIPWVRFAEITDGLSNVFLLGESAYVPGDTNNPATVTNHQDWPIWIGAPNTDESIRYEGRTGAPINCRCTPATMIFAINDDCAFSWHSGGAQFALCDGSARFVSHNISSRTWCDSHSRADGAPLGEF